MALRMLLSIPLASPSSEARFFVRATGAEAREDVAGFLFAGGAGDRPDLFCGKRDAGTGRPDDGFGRGLGETPRFAAGGSPFF